MTDVLRSRCSSRNSRRICAWMVTSSAVVGSSAIRTSGRMQCYRNHDALARAARELMRVLVEASPTRRERARGPASRQHGRRRPACSTPGAGSEAPRSADHAHDRIERGHGLLKDDGDVVAADPRMAGSSSPTSSRPQRMLPATMRPGGIGIIRGWRGPRRSCHSPIWPTIPSISPRSSGRTGHRLRAIFHRA